MINSAISKLFYGALLEIVILLLFGPPLTYLWLKLQRYFSRRLRKSSDKLIGGLYKYWLQLFIVVILFVLVLYRFCTEPELTLQLIFFDGEEAFKSWTSTDSLYGYGFVKCERKVGQKLHNTLTLYRLFCTRTGSSIEGFY